MFIVCIECPANFTHIPSVNGCYKVVTRKLQWSAAGEECRSEHRYAHLLVINDAAEQSAVAEMLANRECYFVLYVVSFLPRCMECRRGLAMRIPSVRLSVCPSVRPSVRQTREL